MQHLKKDLDATDLRRLRLPAPWTVQELLSVVASLGNLAAHIMWYSKLKRSIRDAKGFQVCMPGTKCVNAASYLCSDNSSCRCQASNKVLR